MVTRLIFYLGTVVTRRNAQDPRGQVGHPTSGNNDEREKYRVKNGRKKGKKRKRVEHAGEG